MSAAAAAAPVISPALEARLKFIALGLAARTEGLEANEVLAEMHLTIIEGGVTLSKQKTAYIAQKCAWAGQNAARKMHRRAAHEIDPALESDDSHTPDLDTAFEDYESDAPSPEAALLAAEESAEMAARQAALVAVVERVRATLTPRQIECFDLLRAGKSRSQIARAFQTSPANITYLVAHIANAFKAQGITSGVL